MCVLSRLPLAWLALPGLALWCHCSCSVIQCRSECCCCCTCDWAFLVGAVRCGAASNRTQPNQTKRARVCMRTKNTMKQWVCVCVCVWRGGRQREWSENAEISTPSSNSEGGQGPGMVPKREREKRGEVPGMECFFLPLTLLVLPAGSSASSSLSSSLLLVSSFFLFLVPSSSVAFPMSRIRSTPVHPPSW